MYNLKVCLRRTFIQIQCSTSTGLLDLDFESCSSVWIVYKNLNIHRGFVSTPDINQITSDNTTVSQNVRFTKSQSGSSPSDMGVKEPSTCDLSSRRHNELVSRKQSSRVKIDCIKHHICRSIVRNRLSRGVSVNSCPHSLLWLRISDRLLLWLKSAWMFRAIVLFTGWL